MSTFLIGALAIGALFTVVNFIRGFDDKPSAVAVYVCGGLGVFGIVVGTLMGAL